MATAMVFFVTSYTQEESLQKEQPETQQSTESFSELIPGKFIVIYKAQVEDSEGDYQKGQALALDRIGYSPIMALALARCCRCITLH